MKNAKISRRSFLLGLAACSAAGILTACKGDDTPASSASTSPEAPASSVSELEPIGLFTVKDCRVLNEVLQKLPEKEKSTSTYLNYLSVKKRNGEYLSWSSSGTQKQYSLINFWASWDKESIAIKDSLYALCEKFSKNNFRVVNFSLDYNKEEWGKNTQKDTEQWIEVCDYKGWNNFYISSYYNVKE
jgi:thiol-disulfide isomerase/thioredoxin